MFKQVWYLEFIYLGIVEKLVKLGLIILKQINWMYRIEQTMFLNSCYCAFDGAFI